MIHSRKKMLLLLGLLGIGALVLAACAPQAIVETVVVTQEVQIEGETVIVTEIVELETVVEVTSTPEPIPQGGTIVESTFADATILNPILWNDSSSSDIGDLMFIALVREDPFSGEIIGEAAADWDVSDDGLVYTFNFRDDISWSDGTPLTANDFKFTYDAIGSELVETPRKSNIELVDSIEVLDDHTAQVTFTEVDCTALNNLTLGILPSHVYAADFSDIMESPENEAPSVVSGPFMFQEWVRDDHATLVANPNYYLGAPNVEAWIYRIFADQSAELAAFLAGETDLISVPPQFVSTIEGSIAGGEPFEIYKYFNDGYNWIGLNLADPANPQNGFVDENENEAYDDGEPVLPQDPHPILGDVLVRQAISHAVDYVNIVNKVAFGEGVQTPSNVLPAIGWAFDAELAPYEFDLEQAAALLDEAGWVDSNGDGVREKDGQTLSLKLQTNSGNEVRENVIVLVQESLNNIGFDIDAEALDFSTMVGELLSQTYDMILLGWTNKGSDPDDVGLWEYRFDTVGSGFNFTSYYNERVEELGQAAKSLPGCDTAARGEMYKEIQQILHDDAPYVFLYVGLSNRVWNTRMEGLDPGPWEQRYNIEQWYLQP